MTLIDLQGQPVDPYAPLGSCSQCGMAAWTTTAAGLLCPDHDGVLEMHLAENAETPFDMNAHFESIPSDPKKAELYAALYAIDGICRKNWKTMPDDVQNEIMDAVEKALAAVRSL